MKTFRITFTSNPESGIYSANLVNAESAEQASAYFQTLGNYEIVGCTETNEEPKPGQPVHTVPEEWEAPAVAAQSQARADVKFEKRYLIMTIAELKANTDYRFDHTGSRYGYESRKGEGRIEEYHGRFGDGYIHVRPRWDTSSYVYLDYYIKAD